MWPLIVNVKDSDFKSYGGYTIGGMVDSLYEYLLKVHLQIFFETQELIYSRSIFCLEEQHNNIEGCTSTKSLPSSAISFTDQ